MENSAYISFRIGTKPFKIGGEMAKKNEHEVSNPPLKFTALDLFHF